MITGAGSEDLDGQLRDWLQRSSGFFIDPTVRIANDLRGAPLTAISRRAALPTGTWQLLERDRLPFVLAGIERRRFDGRECFVIFEYCVTGASRVSFWEQVGEGEWEFIHDMSRHD
jgi:hypothetical protein